MMGRLSYSILAIPVLKKPSLPDLVAAIGTYIDGWNERAHPFTWTKTADEILAKANRKKTSNTRH